MTQKPLGEERQYRRFGGVLVDGAPVAYIATLAAVATALSFVPFSIVIFSGKGFPLSQAVYPLLGWILGPLAGGLAGGVGAAVGVLVAPHTSTVPAATILGAVLGSMAAGVMRTKPARRYWWMILSVVFVLAYLGYAGRAVLVNHVPLLSVLLGSFIDWSALLLFVLPTRSLAGDWIASPDLKHVAFGLFLGTWMAAGLNHLSSSVVIYNMLNWPETVWMVIAPVAPFEHLTRCVVGALIGTALISGLRAIALFRSEHAVY
jgi:hypothetical protein